MVDIKYVLIFVIVALLLGGNTVQTFHIILHCFIFKSLFKECIVICIKMPPVHFSTALQSTCKQTTQYTAITHMGTYIQLHTV